MSDMFYVHVRSPVISKRLLGEGASRGAAARKGAAQRGRRLDPAPELHEAPDGEPKTVPQAKRPTRPGGSVIRARTPAEPPSPTETPEAGGRTRRGWAGILNRFLPLSHKYFPAEMTWEREHAGLGGTRAPKPTKGPHKDLPSVARTGGRDQIGSLAHARPMRVLRYVVIFLIGIRPSPALKILPFR